MVLLESSVQRGNMPPKLTFPSPVSHPSRQTAVNVLVNKRSYRDSVSESHPTSGGRLSRFNPGMYWGRAAPLPRSPIGRPKPPPNPTQGRVVSPEQGLMVVQSPVVTPRRSVFHPSITSPVQVSPALRNPSGRAVTKLFSMRPRPFVVPDQDLGASDLGDDRSPAWGADFCMRSPRGTTVYLGRVATVREIEVLSTDLLNHNPYIVSHWQDYWSCSGLWNEASFSSFVSRACSASMLLTLLRPVVPQLDCTPGGRPVSMSWQMVDYTQ